MALSEPWQKLLLHLYQDGVAWQNSLDRKDWRKKSITIQTNFQNLPLQLIGNEFEMNGWITSDTRPADDKRKGFVLRPGKHCGESLLILVPFAHKSDASQHLSLQLGFMTEEKGRKYFFGYRFESPEGGDEHDFFHAQPIQGFGHGHTDANSAEWYPHRYPAFALNAQNLLELVVSMILAYREWQRVGELATTLESGLKNPLRIFLERLKPK